MSKPDRLGVGRMGIQLTLAFVGVALAAVITVVVISASNVDSDLDDVVAGQQTEFTGAIAGAAGSAYHQAGWSRAGLAPVIALVEGIGSGLVLRNDHEGVIERTPAFTQLASVRRQVTDPVYADGRQVGWVTIAYPRRQASREGAAIYSAKSWRWRLEAAGIAVLIAILVAVPLSRLVAAPVDRLIWAARGRARGDVNARVGRVHGLGKLRELSAAFDEMAETREEQDQVRRNLVADVAHELRTPIAVLQAGHEAMLDGLTEATPEHVVSLRDEVLRLARMVDDLQRLASAEAAALQLTLVKRDLAVIAATAAASLVDSFEAANVTLVEQLSKVEVLSDPLRMHEVVVNLLTNALKFTPAGGQVTLQTRQSAGTGQLVVSDTGIGIPEEELPHVAERFFRGQRSSEVAGSGIGLTIVAELIRAHHGNLDFASQPGRGTQVTVTLPLAEAVRSERAGWVRI